MTAGAQERLAPAHSGRHARAVDAGVPARHSPDRSTTSGPRHARPTSQAESTAYLTATGTVVIVGNVHPGHRTPDARPPDVVIPRFTAGADCTDPSYPALLHRVAYCLRGA